MVLSAPAIFASNRPNAVAEFAYRRIVKMFNMVIPTDVDDRLLSRNAEYLRERATDKLCHHSISIRTGILLFELGDRVRERLAEADGRILTLLGSGDTLTPFAPVSDAFAKNLPTATVKVYDGLHQGKEI